MKYTSTPVNLWSVISVYVWHQTVHDLTPKDIWLYVDTEFDMFSLIISDSDRQWDWPTCYQGWGLLSQFSPFRYFPHFPLLSKQTLAIEYHVYIWQVSPQLSCNDTCQIWMWFRESNRYLCKIENFAYGKIANGALVTPTPVLRTDVCFTLKRDREKLVILLTIAELPAQKAPSLWCVGQ